MQYSKVIIAAVGFLSLSGVANTAPAMGFGLGKAINNETMTIMATPADDQPPIIPDVIIPGNSLDNGAITIPDVLADNETSTIMCHKYEPCAYGYRCDHGMCRPGCGGDGDCVAPHQTCRDRKCVIKDGAICKKKLEKCKRAEECCNGSCMRDYVLLGKKTCRK
ncbi:hypothetical protein BJX99DRAFT_254826 [Aspergillus californicus]